jgi:hypothetical protein
MKKSILALLIVAPLSLSLTGCVIAIDGDKDEHSFQKKHSSEFENRKKIESLVLKSEYSEVSTLLGVADFTESYQVKDKEVKVIYYRTQRLHKDGITSKDECTYLQFENNILTEVGSGGSYKRIETL